jgi:hypothetical protein
MIYGTGVIPLVRRHIRNKQFTRNVIDTLGQRVMELVLTIARERTARIAIDNFFRTALKERTQFRVQLDQTTQRLFEVSAKQTAWVGVNTPITFLSLHTGCRAAHSCLLFDKTFVNYSNKWRKRMGVELPRNHQTKDLTNRAQLAFLVLVSPLLGKLLISESV